MTAEDVRAYLGFLQSREVYAHTLKALRRLFRDYLRYPGPVETFKFPEQVFKPRSLPSKGDLARFYAAIGDQKRRALFLVYASSGLRRSEVLTLRRDEVDLDRRTIIPKNHSGATKRSWVSFVNDETGEALKSYLATRKDVNPKLFPIARKGEKKIFGDAMVATGLVITPQTLRFWFCNEMARLGVQDRFIDALCGRTSKSVLARHYTDYSPDRLKEIYDKADLKVLSD